MFSARRRSIRLLHLAAGCLGILLPLATAHAVPAQLTVPGGWDGPLCALTGLCGNSPATGVASIIDFATTIAIPAARALIVGLAVVYFAWYAIALITESSSENTLTETRKAYANAAMGLAFIGIASFLVDTFSPLTAGGNIANETPFYVAAEIIADYITFAVGAFLVFMISLSGFRIIALQGNESEIEKLKKNFFTGLMGVVVLLSARIIVLAIVPTGPLGTHTGALGLVNEVAGMIRFLLEIVAGLAVIALIASGLFYIISLHSDERAQRARRIIISTIIVLVIVITSHMILSTFIR